MIRITQLKLKISHTPQELRGMILKKLRISDTSLLDFIIIKKSLDAREKPQLYWVYTIDAQVKKEEEVLRKVRDSHIFIPQDPAYQYPVQGNAALFSRPVIVGSGPAGLFAAYYLAKEGYHPRILERGEAVEQRIKTVQRFWETGILDPRSNIQFGEGGAGTFSDGKLSSGVSDPAGRKKLVLQTFVEHGAPEEILYLQKPHVGTDHLVKIVSGMRERIKSLGGEFHFQTTMKELLITDGKVHGVVTENGQMIPADIVVLAIGHSARDTFDYLIHDTSLEVVAKPFAVGVRAEHLQKDIDLAQYGILSGNGLPPADYKLTCRTKGGKSVYSFCMCPGGYIVNASSEDGGLCVNGMSYSGRNGKNANAALVVAVKPSEDPLENISFQREMERKAFAAGHGNILCQRLEDFANNQSTTAYGKVLPAHKGATVTGNLRMVLPEEISEAILEAMPVFGRKIKGYDDPDILLSGVETRTSSPVRILRDEGMEASVRGIFPIGEGAGYAGGITSAAIDGIKVFEQIYSRWKPAP